MSLDPGAGHGEPSPARPPEEPGGGPAPDDAPLPFPLAGLPPGSLAATWTLPLPAGTGVREAAEGILGRMQTEARHPASTTHDPERVGLYLATSDAGGRVSIDFWGEALSVGPGLVLPGTFPWTLASAPAGFLAQGLDVRGPVQVLVGGDEAVRAVLRHALLDLEEGRIDRAHLVALDVGDLREPRNGAAAGITLERDGW